VPYAPFFSSKEFHIASFYLPLIFFPVKLFCAFQKVLASHGAAKVSAYVTHAVFPKQSYERFMTSNSGNWQFMQISNFYFFSHSDFLLLIIFVPCSWAR